MECIEMTKIKRISTVIIYMRLYNDNDMPYIHSTHIKVNIKMGVCWKCLVYLLK